MNDGSADEVLKNVKLASPCMASWDDMVGDERVRLCASCDKNVYNFSEMSKDEIAKLLLARGYNICGRFYRRADGTIMTDDCPVGLKALRYAYMNTCKFVAAALGFVISIFLVSGAESRCNAYASSNQDIWTVDAFFDLLRELGLPYPRPEQGNLFTEVPLNKRSPETSQMAASLDKQEKQSEFG